MESWCIEERRIWSFWVVYERGIIPIIIEKVARQDLEHPAVKGQRGRPRTRRIRRFVEDRKKVNFYSQCHERGHNKRKCRLKDQ